MAGMKIIRYGILALAIVVLVYMYAVTIANSPRSVGQIFFPAGPEHPCKNPHRDAISWPFTACNG